MRWFWGFVFVLIGLLFLGNNLSWWHQIDLISLWFYWPILLIIIGATLITRHWRYNYLVMILVVLLSLGFVICTGFFGQKLLSRSADTINTTIEREVPDGVKNAKIIIDAAAIKVNISGSTDKLVSGNFESNLSEATISENISGDTIEYTIKTDKNFRVWDRGNAVNNLNLNLSKTIPIELKIDAGASSIDLDLREQIIRSFSLDSGASSVSVTLGDKTENGAKISIQSGASEIDINIPKEIGASLNVEAPVSGRNFNHLQKISKNEYRTDNFDQSPKKISFDINAGVSSISVDNY